MFNNNDKQEIAIYIPEGMEFDDVFISAGIGKTEIENIIANKINLDIGIGDTKIQNIISKQETKINGGIGRLQISSGELNNLKLDTGVGEASIAAKITGDAKFDNGIGKTKIEVQGNKEDYAVKVSTGIGSITIDNEKCKDDNTYGDGDNKIVVDGGIGNVEIDFFN